MIQSDNNIELCGDYHDFPRLFIIKTENVDLLFCCSLNEKTDRYDDYYTVYSISKKIEDKDPIPWLDLATSDYCVRILQINSKDLAFDGPRKRKLIINSMEVIDKLNILFSKNSV